MWYPSINKYRTVLNFVDWSSSRQAPKVWGLKSPSSVWVDIQYWTT